MNRFKIRVLQITAVGMIFAGSASFAFAQTGSSPDSMHIEGGASTTLETRHSGTRPLPPVGSTTGAIHNDYGFDKTEVRVKLYTLGGVHISRSQARRVLSGLEKFKVILFDFDKVPMVGQAFADEIFRVFHSKYPNTRLQEINMAEGVKFMVERARNSGKFSE